MNVHVCIHASCGSAWAQSSLLLTSLKIYALSVSSVWRWGWKVVECVRWWVAWWVFYLVIVILISPSPSSSISGAPPSHPALHCQPVAYSFKFLLAFFVCVYVYMCVSVGPCVAVRRQLSGVNALLSHSGIELKVFRPLSKALLPAEPY